MVFTTIVNFIRSRGPDQIWRKNKIFRLTAHYVGRRRNCYGIGIRNLHRAAVYATKARQLKKEDQKELRDVRIAAACSQFGISMQAFRIGLARYKVMLNRSLSDLAIHEPKSFESLAYIARERCVQDGIKGIENMKYDNGVYYHNDEQALEKAKYDGKTPANYSAKFKNKIQY